MMRRISLFLAVIFTLASVGFSAGPAAQTELRLELILKNQGSVAFQEKISQIQQFVDGPGSTNSEVRGIIDRLIPSHMTSSAFAAGFIGRTEQTLVDNATSNLSFVGSAIQSPQIGMQILTSTLRGIFGFMDRLRQIENPDLVLIGAQ